MMTSGFQHQANRRTNRVSLNLDDQFLLGTPENVPISFEVAGIGSRFLAAIIDQLITYAVTFFAAVLVVGSLVVLANFSRSTFGDMLQQMGGWLLAAGILYVFVMFFGYSLGFEIAWSGQTPGKRAVGIRVVRQDGGSITAAAALIRNVMRVVDGLPAYYIIGMVTMLVDRRCRRLGDLAAGTIVVKERRDVSRDRLTLPDLALVGESRDDAADRAISAGLGHLTNDHYRLVREFVIRRPDLSPEAARALAANIAAVIAAKLGVAIEEQGADEFLLRVARAMGREGRGEDEAEFGGSGE